MDQVLVSKADFEKKYEQPQWYKANRLRETIFADCPHVGQVKTPYSLCEEIVAKLPDLNGKDVLVWFNPEFYLALLDKFPEIRIVFMTGSKKASVLNLPNAKMALVNPYDIEQIGRKFGVKKFDVVVGNPPYQDSNAKSAASGQLWHKFVEKSFEIVKDEGHVALIHPSPWRKPGHKTWDILVKNGIKYLEIHDMSDGKKTFGSEVSTRYDWYVAQKGGKNIKTKVKDEEGEIQTLSLQDLPFLPNSHIEEINKLLAQDGDEKCEVEFSYSLYDVRKPWMSKIQKDEFDKPIVALISKNGLDKTFYSKEDKGHFGISKVIVNMTGTLNPINDHDGKYGMNQWMFGIRIKSKREGEKVIKALTSDKFQKVWEATQWLSMTREHRIFNYFKRDFWKKFV